MFVDLAAGLVPIVEAMMVESFGMHLTSPSLKSLLSYGVFVLVMLVRPKGLLAR